VRVSSGDELTDAWLGVIGQRLEGLRPGSRAARREHPADAYDGIDATRSAISRGGCDAFVGILRRAAPSTKAPAQPIVEAGFRRGARLPSRRGQRVHRVRAGPKPEARRPRQRGGDREVRKLTSNDDVRST